MYHSNTYPTRSILAGNPYAGINSVQHMNIAKRDMSSNVRRIEDCNVLLRVGNRIE